MQTVESAHVFAVCAGFAAEAGRIGGILDGKVLLIDNDIAVEVRDGNFGGRDKVQVVKIGVVHLSFLVGQLACAIA